MEKLFFIIAMSCLLILFLIMVFLVKEGFPIFKTVSVKDFLTGSEWYPTSDNPRFGIFPLITASVAVTIIATSIALPISLSIAIYLAELANPVTREIIKPVIELIASIPSVVIGFFGMVVLGPALQRWLDLDTGLNLMNAALMLAFMAVPTITSIAEDAISSVPMSLRESSFALGANKIQTIFHIVIPASLSGITTAVLLGISRVMGETMVVLMVAGGSTLIPKSLFDPVRPLTSNIAAEMAEAPVGSNHYYALFAVGLVLFIITFGFNALSARLSKKYSFKGN